MVAPAGAARLLADRPHRAILLSVVIAVATVWISIALAYLTNWPVGFFVGVGGAVSYALARIGSHWNGSHRSGPRGQLDGTRPRTTLLDSVTP
jgi:zinc/manganese transport system permease protein